MPEGRVPTREEVQSYLRERRNWGRWPDEQKGLMNLITPEKCLRAAGLVKTGQRVSLSRDFPKTPGPGNPNPAQHFMRASHREDGSGAVVDYYGLVYHGYATTHIDALCHVWDENGVWGGKEPKEVLTGEGTKWGGIEHWREGIVTRGVLLDIPRYRGTDYITLEAPVHGWDLEGAAAAQGVALEPGDALLVYSGRERYFRDHPDWNPYAPERPGLHASCLPYLRDHDVAVLGWDFLDASPNEYGLPWTVHGAIFSYGIGLLDNALLEPLAQVCADERRYEFMLTIAPLPVVGGTGSPANPIALF